MLHFVFTGVQFLLKYVFLYLNVFWNTMLLTLIIFRILF